MTAVVMVVVAATRFECSRVVVVVRRYYERMSNMCANLLWGMSHNIL